MRECSLKKSYQIVVDSEKGHLTRFIEQVGEGDEGFSLLQVQDQNRSDERHALNLKHQIKQTEQL